MRSKNIPLLNRSPPENCKEMIALNLMHSPVICFNFIAPVHELYRYLENTEHSGFPVLNGHGRPIGIVERDALIAMLKHRMQGRGGSMAAVQQQIAEIPMIKNNLYKLDAWVSPFADV